MIVLAFLNMIFSSPIGAMVANNPSDEIKKIVHNGTADQINQALIKQIKQGDVDNITWLVSFGNANVNYIGDKQNGFSPLIVAVREAAKNKQPNTTYVGIIQYLCSKGASIDHQDSNGYTPLRHAINHKNDDLEQLLCTLGANGNIPSNNGRTPNQAKEDFKKDAEERQQQKNTTNIIYLKKKFQEKKDQNIQSLKEQLERDQQKLQSAQKSTLNEQETLNEELIKIFGNIENYSTIPLEEIKTLLDLGADIHGDVGSGHTPLHQAIRHCANVDLIKLLLNYKADPDKEAHHGATPLSIFNDTPGWSFARPSKDIKQLLVKQIITLHYSHLNKKSQKKLLNQAMNLKLENGTTLQQLLQKQSFSDQTSDDEPDYSSDTNQSSSEKGYKPAEKLDSKKKQLPLQKTIFRQLKKNYIVYSTALPLTGLAIYAAYKGAQKLVQWHNAKKNEVRIKTA